MFTGKQRNILWDLHWSSSPGLDRALKKDKDFERYKGKEVELKLFKAHNGIKQFEGVLKELTSDNDVIVYINDEEVSFNRKEIAIIRLLVKF